MNQTNAPVFAGVDSYQPTEFQHRCGVELPAFFGNPADEYQAANTAAGLFDLSDRGLIRITGSDRKTWLHNLVTNAVKTIDEGQGNYAFSVDVKGRIQFDLNLLVLADEIWLDVARDRVAAAMQHLDMRLITEDVQMSDMSAEWARLAVCGPKANTIAEQLGVSQLATLPQLGHLPLSDGGRFIRHDLTGACGFELIAPRAESGDWWQRLVEFGAIPCGTAARDALEIEAGLPRWGRDLDDQILPPETGQSQRGISYNKGCYLGQEVIERMRSRGVLAKRLMRVTAAGDANEPMPVTLTDQANGQSGRLLSLINHPASECRIGMAHVRANLEPAVELKTPGGLAVTLGSVIEHAAH
jgi:folate-binding protein YgfZ